MTITVIMIPPTLNGRLPPMIAPFPLRFPSILGTLLLVFTLPGIAREPRGKESTGLTGTDWQGIQAAHQSWQYSFQPLEESVWQARNPGQQWKTRFDGRGFITQPEGAAWKWGLELSGYGFGEKRQAVGGKPGVKVEGNRFSYQWDENVSEWYVNDSRGLEHGFDVAHRPAGAAEGLALDFVLDTRGGLRPDVAADAQSVIYRNTEGAAIVTYSGLKVWDADGQVLPSQFVAGPAGSVVLRVDESSARYPIVIDPIAQQAYLKASNTGFADKFGTAVAMSGDTLVVGAPEEDSSVAESGAAYVFVRNAGTWTQQAFLKASNPGEYDAFGESVAISGDTVVIGARGEQSNATGVNGDQNNESAGSSGAAYVFTRSGGAWSQQAYLKAVNTAVGYRFGTSVAISGDTVIVGSPGEATLTTGVNGNPFSYGAVESGAAYVFTRSGGSWSQQAYLKASNTGFQDLFGTDVSISGDTAVVTATHERSNATGVNGDQSDNSAINAGAAYVFTRNGGTWSQQAYLKASNAEGYDFFGGSASVAGDTIVIGSVGESSAATGVNGNQSDNSLLRAGAAYIFTRSGGTWSQQAYLKASNAGADDQFGNSVAVSGDQVVVGAYLEDSAATGVNGAQTDNSASDSGAVYVFARSGGTWSQQDYLKASNTQAADFFGDAVEVSLGTVVVGARLEDSAATGVGGNQADNSAERSGAVYTFLSTVSLPDIHVQGNGSHITDGDSTPPASDHTQFLNTTTTGSSTRVFSVQNTGTSTLNVTGITFTGAHSADFSVTTPTSFSVAPGSSSNVTVQFTPGALGLRTAWITLASNDPDDENPYAFAIEGTGVLPAPTVTSISPTSGSTGGGTSVTITGTNFTGATGVTFDGVAATHVVVTGDTSITCTAPAGTAGAKSVIVTTPGGSNAANTLYTYSTASPLAALEAYLKASNTGGSDFFGFSVAVSGDTAVVGAAAEDSSTTGINSTPDEGASTAGAAYVFVRSGTTWSQQAYLKAAQVTAGDQFGVSVAVSGDTVVVGAYLEDSSTTGINSTPNEGAVNAGAAYVFVRSGTTWSQQAYLKAAQVTADDRFGYSVAVSGDTVVVGADGEDSSTTGINSTPNEGASASGAAYVFVRSGTTWSQQAYLKAAQVAAGDNFGYSVAVSGDTVVVGAPLEDSSTTGINSTPDEGASASGAAYVFVRSGTTWSQQAYLKAAQVTANDEFGYSVAVSGDTVVVGADREDSSTTGINSTPNEAATDAGAAYVFVRSGTTWSQQAYLKAAQVTASDFFGRSVAVSGDTVVIGAYAEDSSTTGINSTPNEGAGNAGAAYVFVRSGTTWSQQAYLKAAQVTASDQFGNSVAASGDTVIVGADREDSSTTGINSTPDEGATNAGAAYIFDLSSTVTAPTLASIAPTSGSTAGGTSVTLTGTGFTGATGVTIGGAAATSVVVVNATTITCVTPARPAGTASVLVTTPGGTNAANTLYTYVTPPPEINVQGNGVNIVSGDTTPSSTDHTDFGSQSAAVGTIVRTFTIQNTGLANLTLAFGSITDTGPQSSDFVIGASLPATIAPGGSFTFTVTYNPGAVGTSQATVNIASNDPDESPYTFAIQGIGVNSVPADLLLSNTTVPENAGANATVGTLSTDDADAGQTHAYSLVAGPGSTDNAAFNLSGNTLRLTASANFEVMPSYSVRIQTDDGNGGAIARPFTITVTNVNEMPSFTKGTDQMLPNGTNTAQSISGWATAIDDGDSTVTQALTFGVSNNNNALFTTQPAIAANGTLTFTPSGNPGTATVSVSLTDDNTINGNAALTSAVQTFTITVSAPADYTITTAGGVMTITDTAGNSDTLTISQTSSSTIRFAATSRTFSLNGAANTSGNSGDISLSGITSVVANAGAGADGVNVSGSAMPSLTVNGGTGNDLVNFSSTTFANNASLNVDLTDDDPVPGEDNINLVAASQVVLSGTGGVIFKASGYIRNNVSCRLQTASGNIVMEANEAGSAVIVPPAGYSLFISGNLETTTGTVTLRAKGVVGGAGEAIVVDQSATVSVRSLTAVGQGVGDSGSGYSSYGSVTTTGGAVSITGTTLATSDQASGVDLFGQLNVAAPGAVTIHGTGAGPGVRLGQNTVGNYLTLNSASSISVTGTAGGLGGAGVFVHRAMLTLTGAAALTVHGTGSPVADGSFDYGVSMFESTVTTASGDISVTGIGGGSGTGSASAGTYLTSNSNITSGGQLLVTGTGGLGSGAGNHGVRLNGPGGSQISLVTSSGGLISLTGTRGNGGDAGTTRDISLGDDGSGVVLVGNISNSGDVSIVADSLRIDTSDTTISTMPSGKVTLKPRTAGAAINLGGADEWTVPTLGLTAGELGRITTGSLTIGDTSTGNMTVGTAFIRSAATDIELYSEEDISFTTGSINTGGGTLSMDVSSGAGAIKPNNSGTDVTASEVGGAGNLSFVIAGATVDTEYEQLKVVGGVNLSDLDLVLTGSYVPLLGNTFTVIDNDSNDPVSGTFNGLAQGATINFNGVPLTISYTGGSGNDVVLSAPVATPEIDVRGNSVSIADGDTTPSTADHTDYGNVTLGLSENRGFLIHNTGTANLSVTNVTIGGVHTTDFQLQDTSFLPASIPPGSSRSFQVSFSPSVAGLRTATVSIANNDSDENAYTFAIQGTGVAFPPTVTNVSPASGIYSGGTSVTITGANFAGATGVTIGGTAATSVVVVNATTITCVTPAGTPGTASVLVTTPGGTNAANSLFTYLAPSIVVHNGATTADPVLANGGLPAQDFGLVNVSTSSAARSYTIANTGDTTLTLGAIVFASGDTSQFSLNLTGVNSSLAPGASTTFTATFSPTSSGVKNASIAIPSNNPGSTVFTIPLTGSGNTAPDIISNGGGPTASLSFLENLDSPFLTVSTTDAENQTLSYALSGPDAALFTFDSGARTLRFTTGRDFENPTDANTDGVYQVTVAVSDIGTPALTDSQALSITVTNANEQPSFIAGPNQLHNLDSGDKTVANWATGMDDGDSTVTQTLSFLISSNSNPALFSAGPAVGPNGTLSYTLSGTTGTATIGVRLQDDASIGGQPAQLSPVQTFTIVNQAGADYAISYAGGDLTITDLAGNGDTLLLQEKTGEAGSVRFSAFGRTFSVNGALQTTNESTAFPMADLNSVTMNAAAGNDGVTIQTQIAGNTLSLPSLTINGGTGNDTVQFSNNVTFKPGASLNADLQDDDATPGEDRITVASNANLLFSGAGGAVFKASRNVLFSSGSVVEVANGNILIEANQQNTATAGNFSGVELTNATLEAMGTGSVTIRGRSGNVGGFIRGALVHNTSQVLAKTGGITIEGQGQPGHTNVGNFGVGIGSGGTTGVVRAVDGDVSITGIAGSEGASTNNFGVAVEGVSEVSATGAGAVTIEGRGGNTSGTGSDNQGVIINTTGSKVTTEDGKLTITGEGGGGAGSAGNQAVFVPAIITLGTTGTGEVEIIGTPGGTGSGSGISLTPAVSSDGGDITLSGTAAPGGGEGVFLTAEVNAGGGDIEITGVGAGTGNNAHGVRANQLISTTGTGSITLLGTASPTGHGIGVNLTNTTSTVQTGGGSISITGIGGSGGTFTNSAGVRVSGLVSGPGAGASLRVHGTAGSNGQWYPHGVEFFGLNADALTSGGDISITGIAGDGDTIAAHGLNFTNGAGINAGNGSVSLHGTGGAGTGSTVGVFVLGTGAEVVGTGGIHITGIGGTGTGAGILIPTTQPLTTNAADIYLNGTGSAVNGVGISGGSAISASGGNITLIGRSFGPDTGTYSGLLISQPITTSGTGTITLNGTASPTAPGQGVAITNAPITTGGGSISITGVGGGAGTAIYSGGVRIGGSTLSGPSAGASLTIHGTGGGTTGINQHGVDTFSSTQLLTSGGNIILTGIGGANATQTSYGLQLSGTTVSTGGTGSITLTGTGGAAAGDNLHGVNFEGSANVNTNNGPITITGAAGGQNATLGGRGIQKSSPATITVGGDHDLTLVADSIALAGFININALGDDVIIRQKTAGTAIDIGGADVVNGSPLVLGVSEQELGILGAERVLIGDASTGDIRVTDVISPSFYHTLRVGKAVSFTGTGGFSTYITSESVFDRMEVDGAITIDPAATLTGSAPVGFSPSSTAAIPVIQNVSAGTTTGSFSGKPEGSPVSFPGFGSPLVITYAGSTDSNDIVLYSAGIPVVRGNSVTITSGDASPSVTDHTDFGDVAFFGTTNLVRTFMIINDGRADLTGLTASVSAGSPAGAFTLSSPPTNTVAPGGATLFSVAFDPAAAGPYTSNVSVNANGLAAPYTFSIAGNGVVQTGDVVSINRTALDPSRSASVTWQVVFSSPVTGLTASNFSLVAGGSVAGATISSIETAGPTAPDSTWNVTVNTGTGDGTLGLNLVDDTDISRTLSNLPFVGQVYTIDKTPPSTTSFTRLTPAVENTNADILVFRATFGEPVMGVNAMDFEVTGTTGGITNVSSFSPSQYDITVSGGDIANLNGTVGLDLVASIQNISDLAGNNLPDDEPVIDQTYLLDNIEPTVTMHSGTGDPAINAPIPVTATFSENVTDFIVSDIVAANASVLNFAGSGRTYTFDLVPTGAGVTVTADISANVASDDSGNGNTAATQLRRTIMDQVSIAATAALAVEGGATGLYTFSRSGGEGDLTVDFELDVSSSALAGTDFNLSGSGLTFDNGTGMGSVIIPDGSSTATITLTALIESLDTAESFETARLNLVPGGGYSPAVSPDDHAIVTLAGNGFLVTTTANDGTGSLRQALLNANAIAGTDTIRFSDGSGGTTDFTDPVADTISLTDAQVEIESSVVIAGSGAGRLAVSGSGLVRVFSVTGASTVAVIRDLAIIEGAGANGGGIENVLGASLTLERCALKENISPGNGGGIQNAAGSVLVVRDSTLAANTAAEGAGGIFNSGNLEIINSTISANSVTSGATPNAGGVLTENGTARVLNSTVTGNLGGGSVQTGGILVQSGTLELTSTIIAQNTGGDLRTIGSGLMGAESRNVIGDSSNAPLIAGLPNANLSYVGTSGDPVDARLGVLSDNGGPTQTHSLLGGSPAIDQGSNLLSLGNDQRGPGFARVVTTPDVGAFETQQSLLITVIDAELDEGDSGGSTDFTFEVTRNGDLSTPVTVDWSVAGSGADAAGGSDFVATSGQITLEANQASQILVVPVNADEVVESDESFTVSLSNPSGGYVITSATADGTIRNDDSATLTLSGGGIGAEGGSRQFKATLSDPVQGGFSVAYATDSGTAMAGDDFTDNDGSLEFAGTAGEEKTITVAVNPDSLVEDTESFEVTLGMVTGADPASIVVVDSPRTATMINDDVAILVIQPVGQPEAAGDMVFQVTITNPVDVPITVNYATSNESATSPDDYASASGTINFPANSTTPRTVAVPIVDDSIAEPDETFSIELKESDFGGRFISFGLSSTQGTIENDDAVVVSIAAIDDVVDENSAGGDTGVWRVSRNGVSGNLVVALEVDAASSAMSGDWVPSGADFVSNGPGGTGTVTIPDGVNQVDISLSAIDDLSAEADESVQLNLLDGGGYTVTNSLSRSVTIARNDFGVTNLNDVGEGSLRQAVENANALAGADTVTFEGTVFADAGMDTILLGGTEIFITSPVTIEGPGADRLTISGNDLSRIFSLVIAGDVTIRGLTLADGNAIELSGGAIYCDTTDLFLEACHIKGNRSNRQAGGLGIFNGSEALIRDCTISGNLAEGASLAAGGVLAAGSRLTIANSTISGNEVTTSTSSLAAAGVFGGTETVIVNTTITGNVAANPQPAGGLCLTGVTEVRNSLIAGNVSAGLPFDLASLGATITAAHNLVGDADSSGGIIHGSDGNIVGNGGAGVIDLAAVLEPVLGANGGPTPTHRLLPGSPAVDGGDPAFVGSSFSPPMVDDQRGVGFPRVIKGLLSSSMDLIDIGAYELIAAPEFSDADLQIKADGGPINLASATGATPPGGTFSGPGVSDGVFDPSGLAPGIYRLTYTYEDEFGARNSSEFSVSVEVTSTILRVSPPKRFTATPIGRTSKLRQVSVSNVGEYAAVDLRTLVSGSGRKDYRVDQPALSRLAPAAATTFRALFRPKREGNRRATVTVVSGNAPPVFIRLKGKGLISRSGGIRPPRATDQPN